MRASRRGVAAKRVLLWVCLAAVGVRAWPQAQGDDAVPTLHVYVNTVQIPVLVLGRDREPLTQPVAPNRFSVSLDSGPWFRATHVRQEGEDPIALAVLLDATGDPAQLMSKMDDAIANLAAEGLRTQDRVSVYSMDCKLIHLMRDQPADSASLRAFVDEVLKPQMNHDGAKQAGSNCGDKAYLWDSLAYVVSDMDKRAGRRVIVAITSGRDSGSRNNWNELKRYAQGSGVAIFGLTWVPGLALTNMRERRLATESAWPSVCELSGGMLQMTTTDALQQTFRQLVTMVRERYIVEFPRPYKRNGGRS